MARLKKDHSGYRSHGLYKKYKVPTTSDPVIKHKSKKDTNKWCRGKVGVEHDWHRFQSRKYDWEVDDYVIPWSHVKCFECGKSKYQKTAKSIKFPLHLWIDHKNEGYTLIPVRVNGKLTKVDYYKYQAGKYWCNDCGYWH